MADKNKSNEKTLIVEQNNNSSNNKSNNYPKILNNLTPNNISVINKIDNNEIPNNLSQINNANNANSVYSFNSTNINKYVLNNKSQKRNREWNNSNNEAPPAKKTKIENARKVGGKRKTRKAKKNRKH